jgi:hypothetical protein
MTFTMDTSAFIGAWDRAYPPDVFPGLWEAFDQMVADGDLRALHQYPGPYPSAGLEVSVDVVDGDPGRCVEPLYQLTTVDFRRDGSWSTYVCVRCGYERLVGPGKVHPQTI